MTGAQQPASGGRNFKFYGDRKKEEEEETRLMALNYFSVQSSYFSAAVAIETEEYLSSVSYISALKARHEWALITLRIDCSGTVMQ